MSFYGPCLRARPSEPNLPDAHASQVDGKSICSENSPARSEKDFSEITYPRVESFIGPTIPSEADILAADFSEITYPRVESFIGPTIPSEADILAADRYSDDKEDCCESDMCIGPHLSKAVDLFEKIEFAQRAQELEARASTMKEILTGKSNSHKLQRESWMLQLPPLLSQSMGLVPRSFRAAAAEIGDQSVWTETPSERKSNRKVTASDPLGKSDLMQPSPSLSSEDAKMQAHVDAYNKRNRPKSLMDIHQEKRQKVDVCAPIRRPFDRERDLKLHRSQPKDKRDLLERAKSLNSKFLTGTAEKKFL